jgi:hypothetical protein
MELGSEDGIDSSTSKGEIYLDFDEVLLNCGVGDGD